MNSTAERSDQSLLDLLRNRGPMAIHELISVLGVTATAVRLRLARLVRHGQVERVAVKSGRGRPSHRYMLTEKARRQIGSNFSDLTIALWQEVRSIADPAIRGGLLKRISKQMASLYGGQLPGDSVTERMQGVTKLMADRDVPFAVEHRFADDRNALLPVLTAQGCPYPDLAEQDRGICAVEKMLFSELLGEDMRLSDCRLDGATCCRFETN